MNTKSNRLFFIDAMRAWAILMMLQGHFIDGLLDPIFRDSQNFIYNLWLYFRGITAPVFFTVSGFIFTYLLVRVPQKGFENPRVKKGVRRGLQLILIGYLLRLNLFGLFKGEVYSGFYLVDVLHCIGLSILCIIGIYLLSSKRKKFVFPLILVGLTLLLFLFESVYKQFAFSYFPTGIANYFTKVNGSVFTIIPWLGYTTIGGALALLLTRFKNFKYLYPAAIGISILVGYVLTYQSSNFFIWLYAITGVELFQMIQANNYLFIRLGDVFFVFAVFMVLRSLLAHKTILKIGANTLTIYVVHFIILYGSFTGLGLYKFFHHALTPSIVIPGALAFMIACTYLSLQYAKYESDIKGHLYFALQFSKEQLIHLQKSAMPIYKEVATKIRLFLQRLVQGVRG
ncbi:MULTISPECIES: acyltransferase family protein [Flavobacteriaceae]|uniref:acyltransferase family protein n=1 Tax=Flavobacteriaceae TaxID=49546 RepID=UPI001492344C|nr:MULTISPECIES: acyltransferase family protein [Allomuricauda]MDC6364848.1 heparan-alpha-glucosaminide N-acetyltransferase domain-containing protein [Muricauda sp. AC10]